MNHNIQQAIEDLRKNSARYTKFERYYAGMHELSFATEKFVNAFGTQFREFAMNLCPAVCDALKDKLKITGFAVDAGPANDALRAARSWDANRMEIRSGEIHKEALKNGDAYAIVWPGDDGRARIFPNKAANVSVTYDDESARIIRAAKFWRTASRHTRLNLYFPDRIERYITCKADGPYLPEASDFVPFTIRSAAETAPPQQGLFETPHLPIGDGSTIANPFGTVPVFHFANNADIGAPGRSELEPAIPIQDGLNKAVLDMLVAMEFSAFRQRWVAGIETASKDADELASMFESGPERVWIASDSDSKFGDFDASPLDQFLQVKDSFRIDIASVTGTPLHYLMPHMRGQPSGETLRRSETRFLAKVRDRQAAFGQTWAEIMEFALRIEKGVADVRLRTRWEDASPTSERERLENILLKKEIGLPPHEALLEAGYGKIEASAE